MKASVVIPVFNERESLPLVVADIPRDARLRDRRRRQRLDRRDGRRSRRASPSALVREARTRLRKRVPGRRRRARSADPAGRRSSSSTATTRTIRRRCRGCSRRSRPAPTSSSARARSACASGRAPAAGALRQPPRLLPDPTPLRPPLHRPRARSARSAGTPTAGSACRTRTSAGRARCRSRRCATDSRSPRSRSPIAGESGCRRSRAPSRAPCAPATRSSGRSRGTDSGEVAAPVLDARPQILQVARPRFSRYCWW